MRVVRILAGLMCFFAAALAFATPVKGKLVIASSFYKEAESLSRGATVSGRDYYWQEPNGILPIIGTRIELDKDISIVILGDKGKKATPDDIKTVKVRAGGLDTTVVVTRPGSALRFRNVDPFDHELYSPQLPTFAPERQSTGAFRPVDFTQEGVFEIRCKLVPHFLGYVLVTNATAIASIQRDGSFSAGDLEPGRYTLKVFYAGRFVHSQKLVVGEPAKRGRETPVEVKLKTLGESSDSQTPDAKKEKEE